MRSALGRGLTLLLLLTLGPAQAHLMVAQRGTLNLVGDGAFVVMAVPVEMHAVAPQPPQHVAAEAEQAQVVAETMESEDARKRAERKERKAAAKAEARAKREAKSAMRR